jgi:Mg-chelatase subunit ChlD
MDSQTDQGLAHSLIEGDKQTIEEGQLIEASLNQGMFGFNPDLMFDNLVENYQNAENIYGESILRLLAGMDGNAMKKNLRFPEFKRELKKKIEEKFEELKDKGLLDGQDQITDKGVELASLTSFMEELDELETKGVGEKITKERFIYGERGNVKDFKKGDRFSDIAIKSSVKKAIKRSHKTLHVDDLQTFERIKKGQTYIVYALDASGSMKGKKIGLCKKAGIALAYKAMNEHDKVGLIVFGAEIEEVLYPTTDFLKFIRKITDIKAKAKTDLAKTIETAIDLFPKDDVTKHLVLLTDALATAGESPEGDTLKAAEKAIAHGITISLIGVGIEDGEELAKKVVEIGNGHFKKVTDPENLDLIVLEDYYNL